MAHQPVTICLLWVIAAGGLHAADACPPDGAPGKPAVEHVPITTNGVTRDFWIRRDEVGIEYQSSDAARESPPIIRLEKQNLTLRRKPSSDVLGDVRIYTIDGEPADELTQQRATRDLAERPEVRSAGPVLLESREGRPNVLRYELLVTFDPSIADGAVDSIIKEAGAELVRRSRRNRLSVTVRVIDPTKTALSDALRHFQNDQRVQVVELEYRVTFVMPPSGVGRAACRAWHHDNDGSDGGTADADLDTNLAWAFTTGAKVTAVIDEGFFAVHPELLPNLWVNSAEIAGNGLDDDGNGLIDDVNGWNFVFNKGTFEDNSNHGTKAAGLVGAAGSNPHGIKGSAPTGKVMLLLVETPGQFAEAIDYAVDYGADVISVSFTLLNTDKFEVAIKRAARSGRAGLGCVVAVALDSYSSINHCPELHYQRLCNSVVLVSYSTSRDEKYRPFPGEHRAFGNCMSLMAPGRKIATISDEPDLLCGQNYFSAWGGTSAATPLTAGVASLVLTEQPALTFSQVKHVLEDTCDKIEPLEGCYSPRTGFSTPATGVATHGFGRLNAFEAVRLVAPQSEGGRGGVDLLVRDNALDWGNTEQPSTVRFNPVRDTIPFWESPDIKIDSDPGMQPAPTNSAEFEALVDEQPQAAVNARIFVRVRNRGPIAANDVRVRVYATRSSDLPPFPEEFWNGTPLGSIRSSVWDEVGQQVVPSVDYSGASAAASGADPAAIVTFDWNVPAGRNESDYWVLALVENAQDLLSPWNADLSHVVPRDNNASLRRIADGMPIRSTSATSSRSGSGRRPDSRSTACWCPGLPLHGPTTICPNTRCLVRTRPSWRQASRDD